MTISYIFYLFSRVKTILCFKNRAGDINACQINNYAYILIIKIARSPDDATTVIKLAANL